MADVPVLNAAAENDAPAKSKKWLIIGVAACLVLAGGGAAAWFLIGQGDAHGKKQQTAKAKEPLAPPLYVALDPPFVSTLKASSSCASCRSQCRS